MEPFDVGKKFGEQAVVAGAISVPQLPRKHSMGWVETSSPMGTQHHILQVWLAAEAEAPHA